jgi:hypothetical protein
MGRRASTLCALTATLGSLVLVGGSTATTGVDVTVPVKVTLTDRGVSFSHRLKPTTNTTLAVRVINRSHTVRRFTLGWRKTHMLQRGGHEEFYFTFYTPGKIAWRSAASSAKDFRGTIRVKLATGLY